MRRSISTRLRKRQKTRTDSASAIQMASHTPQGERAGGKRQPRFLPWFSTGKCPACTPPYGGPRLSPGGTRMLTF